jgi:DNA-binding NtrC family response regulator
VLETGIVTRIGSRREVPVDVRVLSATNRNLESACEAGTFRWDLLYRINTVTLPVPPLRKRRDELQPLAEHFLARACDLGSLPPRRLSSEALVVLGRYQWPGNIRELRNAMERAALVSPGPVVTVSDLPPRLRQSVDATVRDESGQYPPVRPSSTTPFQGHAALDEGLFKSRVRDYEIRILLGALESTGWNKTAAARTLQMPLRTLMHKIRVHGLQKGLSPAAGTPLGIVGGVPGEDGGFRELMRRFEAELLAQTIEETDGNKAEAARRLGLPLSTVLYKLKSYAI